MMRWGLLGLTAAWLCGCTQPRIYSWGHYEDLIYASYASPGKWTPEVQLTKLEEDYQKARAANKPVPPGFHAHVGYLYFAAGKADQARKEFETEKELFPESAVFMDRMLANTKAK